MRRLGWRLTGLVPPFVHLLAAGERGRLRLVEFGRFALVTNDPPGCGYGCPYTASSLEQVWAHEAREHPLDVLTDLCEARVLDTATGEAMPCPACKEDPETWCSNCMIAQDDPDFRAVLEHYANVAK